MKQIFFAIFLYTGIAAQQPCDEILYVPENLKSNVAFWKMVYGGIGTSQGIIHDIDSMHIVYDTITPGRSYTPARQKMINENVRNWSERLRKMAETDRSSWDDTMKFAEARWGRSLSTEELLAAAERMRHQQGIRERFAEGIKRSGRYLEYIKGVFEKYKLPEELAYLPHVESSFDYTAYSKVGAAGIWQFMRGTGKEYMRVGNVVDERLDPMKATVAAAKLLSANYRKLKSWPLAITAYNHGAKSMADAVALHGTTDIGVIVNDYQRKSFKFASKNFYASFVAAYEVAKNYREYFSDLEMYPPIQWTETKLTAPLKPSSIASRHNISLATLRSFNLDIRPVAFKKDLAIPKGHLLKLPSTADTEPVLLAGAETQSDEEVIAKSEVNESKPETATSSKNKNDKKGTKKEPKPEKTEPKPLAPPVTPDYLKEVRYDAAQKKDTVYADYDYYTIILALKDAASYSDISDCYLCPFDTMLYNLSIEQADKRFITVLAQIDETIHHLAEWAGISYKTILAANRSISKRGMRIGQKVKIPLKERTIDEFRLERLSHHMGIEEDFFNNYRVKSTDTVMVTTGGQVWAYCMDNDIPFWLVMKANPQVKNWNVLRPQNVVIPVITPTAMHN